MEELVIPGGALAGLIFTALSWFLRTTMADLKRTESRVDGMAIQIALLEARGGELHEMKKEIHSLRDDVIWIRERLAGMPQP